MTEIKYCHNCGGEMDVKAEMCPECGVRQSVNTTELKNPGVAAVLSFLFCGLGQIYNGEIAKGIVILIAQIVNVLLMFVGVGLITYPLLWIIGVWDAYTIATKINARGYA